MTKVINGIAVSEGDRVEIKLVEGYGIGSFRGYWGEQANEIVTGTMDSLGTVTLDHQVQDRVHAYYFSAIDYRYELVNNLTTNEPVEEVVVDSPDLQILDRELEELLEPELGAVVLREGDPVAIHVVMRYTALSATDLNAILCNLDEADLLEHTTVEVGKFEEVKGE